MVWSQTLFADREQANKKTSIANENLKFYLQSVLFTDLFPHFTSYSDRRPHEAHCYLEWNELNLWVLTCWKNLG